MSNFLLLGSLALVMATAPVATHAQATPSTTSSIPIRAINAPSAISTEIMGTKIVVRALSTGAVLINDVQKHRVLHLDATLQHARVVMDSAATSPSMGGAGIGTTPSQLIAYPGDSTLFVDLSSSSLLVLDADGNVAHVMALPRPRDAMFLARSQFGAAVIDPQGHLVYRGVVINLPKAPDQSAGPSMLGMASMFKLPEQPDSAPIVRANFDTRQVDTLITVKTFKPGAPTISTDQDGNIVVKIVVNPLDTGDEWAMIADGSIAIVRAHDYHIDWRDVDGTKRSTPKMAFDWVRLTDEQKKFKADSLRPDFEKRMGLDGLTNRTIPTPNGPRKIIMNVDVLPPEKMGDYEPAIAEGAVRADLDNNLWIVPRTAAPSGDGGVRYDVVNRDGVVFQRVQFPKGKALVGFGPNGAIFVMNMNGATSTLERTTIK